MKMYLIFLTILFPTFSCASQNRDRDACSKNITCGSLVNISYPFYDGSTRPIYCGHPGFKLDCINDIPRINISDGHEYYVKSINANANNIKVYRRDKWTDYCPDSLTNTAIDLSKFYLSSSDQNITFFYGCNDTNAQIPSDLFLHTACNLGGHKGEDGYYLTQEMADQNQYLFQLCESNLILPIKNSEANKLATLDGLIGAFRDGFELGFMAENEACLGCVGSGGECGYNWSSMDFVCRCPDADYGSKCGLNSTSTSTSTSSNKGHKKRAIIIGISIGVVVLIALFGCYSVFTRSKIPPYILQKHKPIYKDVEDSLKNYASLVPKRYSYTYIEKITKSFKEKLGEGGYGSVFMGSLQDGRNVAVKVSKRSKGDGQDFVNEVMSISRTSHVNVVPLLGFCFEGHKRALIYEFMPNGSLEKFIRGRDLDQNNQHLSTLKLFEISLGVARGLEYLHRGCNTRMVHFDIKPHNILLDAEFTPKISDFGLAKSLKQNESIISMSGARGTAGYIAPEIVFRSFGGVSYKADVYSFGMMVLEMVGCRKRVNGHNVEDSSETYFPQWIYKQLEQGTNTNTLDSEMSLNEEKEVERKMILVGLGCIQTNPSSRPTMSRVVEMLEGKADLLEVPPMPTLASPPREHQHATNDDSINAFSSSVYART